MGALAAGVTLGAAVAVAQQDVPLQPLPDQGGQEMLVVGQDVTGQSVPLQGETPVETVPQPRFEADTQEQAVVMPQPRFVRAPGADGIEVTPLAPPGEGAADGAPGAEQPVEEGLGAGGAAVGELPDEMTPRGPGDTPSIEESTDGRASARASRFKPAPQDAVRLTRPTGPAVPIDAAPTELRQGVRLRELDKMTGQTETFELAVGDERQVDRLKIRLEACRSPQGNDTHGTMAFLKVWDIREPEEEAFSGWMFAESPSLSALDHPRYDLWVISCTTSSVAASSPRE